VHDAALFVGVAKALSGAMLASDFVARDLAVAEGHDGEVHDVSYTLSIVCVIEVGGDEILASGSESLGADEHVNGVDGGCDREKGEEGSGLEHAEGGEKRRT